MPLQTTLENSVITKLTNWQGTVGTDGIATEALDALDPGTNPYASAVPYINGRLKDWTDDLTSEQQSGNVPSWVVPRLAAILFEGVFDTCVAYWIARGQPAAPAAPLKPDVTKFVKVQVGIFTKLIGAK